VGGGPSRPTGTGTRQSMQYFTDTVGQRYWAMTSKSETPNLAADGTRRLCLPNRATPLALRYMPLVESPVAVHPDGHAAVITIMGYSHRPCQTQRALLATLNNPVRNKSPLTWPQAIPYIREPCGNIIGIMHRDDCKWQPQFWNILCVCTHHQEYQVYTAVNTYYWKEVTSEDRPPSGFQTLITTTRQGTPPH
jgi:hypothetical protein